MNVRSEYASPAIFDVKSITTYQQTRKRQLKRINYIDCFNIVSSQVSSQLYRHYTTNIMVGNNNTAGYIL